ncbi:MAG: hypothetical protein NDF56_02210 [archaeon GB-1845-036]|nr:hypothetical protein [Candidatus Culexmicrobium thermophilum]
MSLKLRRINYYLKFNRQGILIRLHGGYKVKSEDKPIKNILGEYWNIRLKCNFKLKLQL